MWSSSTSLILISSVRRTKRACSRSYEQWTRPTATALGTWRRGTCRPWCQLLWGPTSSSTCILSRLLRWLTLTHLVWNLEALDLMRGSSWYWRKKGTFSFIFHCASSKSMWQRKFLNLEMTLDPLCYTSLKMWWVFVFLNNYTNRTLGVQERYVEASGKTVAEEMMEL